MGMSEPRRILPFNTMERTPRTRSKRVRCRRATAIACLISYLCGFAFAPSAFAHVVLEADVVQNRLRDIVRYRTQSRNDSTDEVRLDALYRLGEAVRGLVELLNQDLVAHGASALFPTLVAHRLQAYGIGVTLDKGIERYVYDHGAFYEYLRRAPEGARAADIRYRLISDKFYRSLRLDTPDMLRSEEADLLEAVAEEEQFLQDFPEDPRVRNVRFFRAADYYRLSKNVQDAERSARYRRVASEALQQLLHTYPGTAEARSAEELLKRIGESDPRDSGAR